MYNDYYDFPEEPFNVTPDPRFLYLTPSHREALASMMYGIKERKGFISMTGEVGTGKTTLIHALLTKLDENVKAVFIFHTHTSFEELLKAILIELDVSVPDQGKAGLLQALNEDLIRRLSQNENVALIIDEAQNLGKDVLEKIRQLSNLETPRTKLLQIILVGQPELEVKLNSPELRQLKDRIGIRRRIVPLSTEDSEKYIDHRLKQVGSSASKAFTKEAIGLISIHGKGVPRRINTICDNAFLIGYGLSRKKIDGDIIREVMNDLGEGSSASPEPGDSIREPAVEIKESVPGPMNRPPKRRIWQFLLAGLLLLAFAVLFFLGGEKPPAKPLAPSAAPSSVAGPPSIQAGTEPTPPPAPFPVIPAVVPPVASSAAPIETPPATPAMAPVDARTASPSAPEKVTPQKEAPPATEVRKEQVISVRQGDSIFSLAWKHYGASNETLADLILEANPGIIDIHRIVIGQKIKIPVIIDESLIVQAPEKGYKISLGTFARRRAARIFKKEPGLEGKKFEIIKKEVSSRQEWYKILAGTFESKEECLRVIRSLKDKRLLPAFS